MGYFGDSFAGISATAPKYWVEVVLERMLEHKVFGWGAKRGSKGGANHFHSRIMQCKNLRKNQSCHCSAWFSFLKILLLHVNLGIASPQEGKLLLAYQISQCRMRLCFRSTKITAITPEYRYNTRFFRLIPGSSD